MSTRCPLVQSFRLSKCTKGRERKEFAIKLDNACSVCKFNEFKRTAFVWRKFCRIVTCNYNIVISSYVPSTAQYDICVDSINLSSKYILWNLLFISFTFLEKRFINRHAIFYVTNCFQNYFSRNKRTNEKLYNMHNNL